MTQQTAVHAVTPYAAELDLALSMAAESAALALSQFGRSEVRRKPDGTLVTRTDEAIDALITSRIHATFPGDAILSEEQLTSYAPATARTWVIDPVDGTTNFARGLPVWGISIAFMVDGIPAVGVVRFPMLNELFEATLGGGSFRNAEPIATLDVDTVTDEQIFMECTRTRKRYTIDLPLKTRMMGSAAYHMCKVAEGRAIAGIEATPKVWDIAASALILTEAGGVLAPFNSKSIFPLPAQAMDYGAYSMPLVQAANERIAIQVMAATIPIAAPSSSMVLTVTDAGTHAGTAGTESA